MTVVRESLKSGKTYYVIKTAKPDFMITAHRVTVNDSVQIITTKDST